MKSESAWWIKLREAVDLMQLLVKQKVSVELRVRGAKIWLRIKTSHFTEKDRPRIHHIHSLVDVPFIKQYTKTNRVKYVANKNGIVIYMNTNIPAAPNCPLVVKQVVQKQSFYNCKT